MIGQFKCNININVKLLSEGRTIRYRAEGHVWVWFSFSFYPFYVFSLKLSLVGQAFLFTHQLGIFFFYLSGGWILFSLYNFHVLPPPSPWISNGAPLNKHLLYMNNLPPSRGPKLAEIILDIQKVWPLIKQSQKKGWEMSKYDTPKTKTKTNTRHVCT